VIVTLKGEENAVGDAKRAENTPTVHKSDLAGGDERFRSITDRVVMKQMPMHGFILAKFDVVELRQIMDNALPMTRRFLMRLAAVACVPAFGKENHVAGVQLYTVRDIVLKRPLQTLQAIADMGYRELEVMRSQVATLAPYFKTAGLQPVSLHFETPLITGNWKAWQHADMPPIEPGITFNDALAQARDHAFRYMVFNYLAPEERLGSDFYRALADKLNAAGEKCRSAGLQFCYHNHDFEFEPKPDGRPIDTLLARLDKNLVRLEVDTFWVSMAGVNAAAFLRQHAGRVEMVHLKDRSPGTPIHYDMATVPNSTFRELGNGDLPLREILQAASQSGVKHYFVEQDFSTDPLQSLRQSYAFLRKAGF